MRVRGTGRNNGLAIVLGLSVALVAADAMAQSYGSWGSSGSYGSYGSSASYGSYGSGGSWGSHGRMGLFARIHARRAARWASHGSYGSAGSSASYGSYGSSGSYASYGSAGSSGSYAYGGSAGAVAYSAGYAPEASTAAATGDAAIKVTLPADAKVFVNDAPTTSTGSERSYVSRGLREGLSYNYAIRVEYQKDGQPVTEDKVVKLSAGQSVSVSFGEPKAEEVSAAADATAASPVKTEVKVQVPAEAKVFLSGSPTKQTGESRTFSTTELSPGQQWANYTIRVELERDGQMLVREETLTVTGGGSYELAFDFDAPATPQLAQMVR